MSFGMFTTDGNDAVADIVVAAKFHNHSRAWTYSQLRELAKQDGFGEAIDTEVRERVYDAIGAGQRKEEFYVR